jgi:adenylate cyclase
VPAVRTWGRPDDRSYKEKVRQAAGLFPESPLRAVQAALEMQAAHQAAMAGWQRRGFPVASIGIGIATGELIAGEMGCTQRAEYTVIGQPANLGARLRSAAQAGRF